MQRKIMSSLIHWRASRNRKPLLLQGARQVGKTWILKEFGEQEFESVAYINFLDDEAMRQVFDGDLAPERLISSIELQTGVRVQGDDTLIIFDEIQECPRAITSLKMFNERLPQLPIVAAGSLLGVALHAGVSFPVGKVDHLYMYPMTFFEFLLATDEKLVAPLQQGDTSLIDSFAQRYTEALKRYYFVGGMPEAVSTFIETDDFQEIRNVQNRLLLDYEHDFSKYAGAQIAERIRMLWNSIPSQLGRQNKKFIYSAVRKGARARNYEEAIRWLVDAGLILQVNRISKPGVPNAAYEDRNAFKLYMLDVGLLGAASRISPQTLIEGNRLFTEFKGALTENYVCQQLITAGSTKPYSSSGFRPFYWSSESSDGEVDFIYDIDDLIVPIEAKAELNLRSKSLRSFVSKYGLPYGYRVSLALYKEQDWITNIPLFAMNLLPGCASLV